MGENEAKRKNRDQAMSAWGKAKLKRLREKLKRKQVEGVTR